MPVTSRANRIAGYSPFGYEPQRTNHWRIDLTPPQGVNMDNEMFILSLSTFDPPSETIEPISIPYANEDRKVAGRVTRDNVSLTVRDYVDKSVYQALRRWQRLVYNSDTGAIGWCNLYKGTAKLVLLGPTLEIAPGAGRTITMYGVWPSKVSISSLDQAGNDQVQITVDLVYDFISMPE